MTLNTFVYQRCSTYEYKTKTMAFNYPQATGMTHSHVHSIRRR